MVVDVVAAIVVDVAVPIFVLTVTAFKWPSLKLYLLLLLLMPWFEQPIQFIWHSLLNLVLWQSKVS